MKKIIVSLLSVTLAASITACAQTTAPADATPYATSSSAVGTAVQGAATSQPAQDQQARMVAEDGAAIPSSERFRGVVEELAVDDAGRTVLQMKKFEGTRFVSTLKVALTDTTKYDFDSKEIANGVALEIFYDAPQTQTQTPEMVDAILIKLLDGEQAVNFNGKLLSVNPDPELEGQGQLEMALLDGSQTEILFNYGPDTQFLIDIKNLKPGDLLNVYHDPIMTMSLPPQSPALEVSAYTPPENDIQPAANAADNTDTAIPKDAQLYEGKVVSVQVESTNPLSGMVEMTDMEGKNAYIFLFDDTLIQNGIDVTKLQAGDQLSVAHSAMSTRSLPPQSNAYSFSLMASN